MSTSAGEILVRVGAQTGEFDRAIARAQGTASNFARTLSSAAGIGGALGLSVALVGLGKAAVNFDASMRNVNSIAKLGETQLGALQKQVLALSKETGRGPKDLADGLYDIVSSGFSATDAVTVLAASSKAATAGLTDTATATKATTAALNAYHLGAGEARRVSDVLFQVVNKGVLTFGELAQNMGDLVPAAAPLGVSLEEVGAAMSTITLQGVPASEAATRVKSVMLQLASPTKELSGLLQANGFASGEAAIKARGFAGVLALLDKATRGSVTETSKLTPEIRALLGVVGLTGKNAATYTEHLLAMRKATEGNGATAAAFAEQSKSISVQWAKAKQAFVAAAIPLMSMLFPALTAVFGKLSEFAGYLERNREGIASAFRQAADAVKTLWTWLDAVARAVGGWGDVFKLVLAGTLASKVLSLTGAFGGRTGLTGGIFASTNAITGRGGLLAALSSIPAQIVVAVIVKEIIERATGSSAAGGAVLGAVIGRAVGRRAARAVGGRVARAVGGRVGGGLGAIAGALIFPESTGSGRLPVWDTAKGGWVDPDNRQLVPDQAHWHGARAQSGLGNPVPGKSAYEAGAVPRYAPITPARPSPTVTGRAALGGPSAVDYSMTPSGGGGGGGGAAADADERARLADEARQKRLDVLSSGLGFLFGAGPGFSGGMMGRDPAQAARLARARAAGAALDLTQFLFGAGPGFSGGMMGRPPSVRPGAIGQIAPSPLDLSYGIAGVQAKAEAALRASVTAQIQAARDALEQARGSFADAWVRLADSGLRAFDARTAKMQAEVQTRLGESLRSIEATRRELTPAERELSDLRISRERERREKALADARSLGDATLIAQAEYDIRVSALEERAAAERASRDAEAEARRSASEVLAAAERESLDEQRRTEREHFAARLESLKTFLTDRGKSVAEKNEAILGAFREFGLDPAFGQAGGDAGGAFATALREHLTSVLEQLRTVQSAAAAVSAAGGKAAGGVAHDRDRGALLGGSLGAGGEFAALGRFAASRGMAAGGIVTAPTFAMIGESGPEAVVPLDQLFGGQTIELHTHVYVGGREVQRTVREEHLKFGRRNPTVMTGRGVTA